MKVVDVHRHFWEKRWLSESAFLQFAIVGDSKRLPFVDPVTLTPRVKDWIERISDPDGTKMIKDPIERQDHFTK